MFQTQVFVLAFLPFAVLTYYLGARSRSCREISLIAAPLVFYGWCDVRFIPLLLGQIATTWVVTSLHERTKWKWPLIAGIAVDLASRGTFKYLNFIFTFAMTEIGRSQDPFNIVLPVGISFFSFQLISYLVDRPRNDVPTYPFRRFARFVLFFPHLIAGPIVRQTSSPCNLMATPCARGTTSALGWLSSCFQSALPRRCSSLIAWRKS